MGNDHQQSVCTGDHKARIQIGILKSSPVKTFCHQSAKMQRKVVSSSFLSTGVRGSGGSGSGPDRGDRQGLLLPHLRGSQTIREVQTYTESEAPESLSHLQKIPDGFNLLCKDPSPCKLFYGINRPEGCLFAYPYSRGLPEVSEIGSEVRRRDVSPSVQSSSLRALLFPPHLHQGHGGGVGVPSSQGYLSDSIPGRPVIVRRVPGTAIPGSPGNKRCPGEPGLAFKSGKIQSSTISKGHLPGLRTRLNQADGLSSGRKSPKSRQGNVTTSGQLPTHNKKSHVSPGSANVHTSSSTVGRVAFSSPTTLHSECLGPQSRVLGRPNISTIASQEGSLVVEKRGEPVTGSGVGLSSIQDGNNGRQRHRMGGSSVLSSSAGYLEKGGVKEILELEGAEGHRSGPQSLSKRSSGPAYTNSFGQFLRSCLHQQAGGHQEPVLVGADRVHPQVGRDQRSVSFCNSSEGGTESSRGFSQQEKAEGKRLGPEPGSLRGNHPKMGETGGGSVRLKGKLQNTEILFPEQVGRSTRGRCSGTDLAVLQVLCFPPSSSDPSSIEKTAEGEHNADSDRTSLAQETMVFHSERSVSGASLDSANPRGSSVSGSSLLSAGREVEPSSLASEEQLLRSKGFSERLIATLLSCRKKETQAIYLKVWKRFNTWCLESSFNVQSSVAVLEFLQVGADKGLAISTLKGQVSALSVFLERQLAFDPWVSRFFKALGRRRPVRIPNFPVWDLSLVLQALTEVPFEPLESGTLEVITLKTVFLVAITTARRVSELEALSIRAPFFQVFPDRIIFKTDPAFLPKVSSDFHRSQEITLPSFCSNPVREQEHRFHCLDVRRCVLQYLSITSQIRKADSLFVLYSGAKKGSRASKRTIARWLRSAIIQAYVARGVEPPQGIKAHSTRAVATSQAECAGASPEQICKAATWSSFSTFVKHYRLDLLSAKDQAFGRKVLQAVVPP